MSDLDAKALKAAEEQYGASSGHSDPGAAKKIITAYLAALPQPQATTVGVKGAWIEWTAFNLLDLGDDELIDVRTVGGNLYPHQPYFNHKRNSSGIIAWRRSALIGNPGAEAEAVIGWLGEDALERLAANKPTTVWPSEGYKTFPVYASPPAPTAGREQALEEAEALVRKIALGWKQETNSPTLKEGGPGRANMAASYTAALTIADEIAALKATP